MDIKTGRPNEIGDYLRSLHSNQWFTFTDKSNKVYANLILNPKMGVGGELVDNPYSLPTEQECLDGLAQLQTEYDALDYARKRGGEYPSTKDFMEAYTEKEIGGNSTKWDAYIINYNKVRTENPK